MVRLKYAMAISPTLHHYVSAQLHLRPNPDRITLYLTLTLTQRD